jgi:hypothetical protein
LRRATELREFKMATGKQMGGLLDRSAQVNVSAAMNRESESPLLEVLK